VTCTAQATYVTGQNPTQHGIVANGWYNRELAEVQFWKQSNHLVTAPKLWDVLRERDPAFTCAKLFWWYNMYARVDYSVTPRPMYPADGRKLFDIYSWPYELRPALKKDLGNFPFPTFWGPAAGVPSPQGPADATSRWIAQCAQWIEIQKRPTLSLVYLPHLDYNMQRLGPNHPAIAQDLQQIDGIVGELLDFYAARGIQVVLLSEYGITPVKQPIHLNRLFRDQGWLVVKNELGRELLDPGQCTAFAVADHQVAHIYVNQPNQKEAVRKFLETVKGVEKVLDTEEQQGQGLNHSRGGDLIAIANSDSWFTYYYWKDDDHAPDFARTVDIHRKPGYDPVELFLDPTLPMIKARIAFRLLQKKLGFRMLMDVIPLDAKLVKGSHGACPVDPLDWPLYISPQDLTAYPQDNPIAATDIFTLIQNAVTAAG
jgi:predicted AlkP superfamily pyrophosphatase or phosphodiesterase